MELTTLIGQLQFLAEAHGDVKVINEGEDEVLSVEYSEDAEDPAIVIVFANP